MREFLLAWVAVAAVMLPLDVVWLRTMHPFYAAALGDMMRPEPRLAAAAVFYIGYAAAVAFFAVRPNLSGGTWMMAAAYGAFFGFAAYGTYDATNHATLKSFSLRLALVDLTWGTCLTAVSAAGAWLILRVFNVSQP
ncbi:MAG: DUF2177 family protein [Beijerinckiaceae bacterium]